MRYLIAIGAIAFVTGAGIAFGAPGNGVSVDPTTGWLIGVMITMYLATARRRSLRNRARMVFTGDSRQG